MLFAANIANVASASTLWEFASILGGVVSMLFFLMKIAIFMAKRFGWKDKTQLEVERIGTQICHLQELVEETLEVSKRSYSLHETPVGEQPKWWCAARDGKFMEKVDDTKSSTDDLANSILGVCANQKKMIRVVQLMMSEKEQAKVDLDNEWD